MDSYVRVRAKLDNLLLPHKKGAFIFHPRHLYTLFSSSAYLFCERTNALQVHYSNVILACDWHGIEYQDGGGGSLLLYPDSVKEQR